MASDPTPERRDVEGMRKQASLTSIHKAGLPEGWYWEEHARGKWDACTGADFAVWVTDDALCMSHASNEVPIPVVLAVLTRAGLLTHTLTKEAKTGDNDGE